MVVLTSTIVTIIIIIIRCVVLPVAAAGIFICSDTRLSLPLQESGLEGMGSSRIGHQPVLAVLTLCRRRSVSQDLAVQDGQGCMCEVWGPSEGTAGSMRTTTKPKFGRSSPILPPKATSK